MEISVAGMEALRRDAPDAPAWDRLPGGLAELHRLMCFWDLPGAGRDLVVETLRSPPVSRLSSTARSSVVRIPSQKMGVVIQAASGVEYAFSRKCEFDLDVLLYQDQAMCRKVRRVDAAGRRARRRCTPDYFVVRRSGPAVVECKAVAELLEQAGPGRPNARYVLDEDGRWRDYAAEEEYGRYGIAYEVWTSDEVSRNWLRNVAFLADHLHAEPPKGVETAKSVLAEAISMSLSEAFGVVGTTRATWYWMCVSGDAFMDFDADPIDRPDFAGSTYIHDSYSAMVCHRVAMAQTISERFAQIGQVQHLCLDPGHSVLYQGKPYRVVSRDEHELVLVPGEGSRDLQAVVPSDQVPTLVEAGLLRASPQGTRDVQARFAVRRIASLTDSHRRIGLKRWSYLEEYWRTGRVPKGATKSTLMMHQVWARESERETGNGFLGVFRFQGSRCRGTRALTADQIVLLHEVAEAFHGDRSCDKEPVLTSDTELKGRARITAANSDYRRLSRERGLAPASLRTLYRTIKRYSMEKSERARRGRRAAYQVSAPIGDVFLGSVHGHRPWQVGHVDHVLLDVHLVSGRTGAVLGKAWLTIIMDAYSRMPVGFALRFDSPSVASVMAAMHDAIERYGRFFDRLVCDQGSEFSGVDFEFACAALRVELLDRPAGRPRYGALIERFFGGLKTRLIEELAGSIEPIADTRQGSSTHDPVRKALWTLPALSRLIEQYLWDIYPKLVHSELGAPHGDVFRWGLAHAGERIARHIAVDDALRLVLSETVPGKTRMVRKKNGPISVLNGRFHHRSFGDMDVVGQDLSVRRCAGDASVVYVFLPHLKRWETARRIDGSLDLGGLSWSQARALQLEADRQRFIGRVAVWNGTNADQVVDLLLALDLEEYRALERRMEIDAEQLEETQQHVGAARDPGAGERSALPAPEQSGASDWLGFDAHTVRPYDDDEL